VIAKVTGRYVKGLIRVVLEQERVDEVEQALQRLDKILKDNRDILKVLYHPVIAREKKKKLLRDCLGGDAPEVLVRFVELIIDRKREEILESLYDAYTHAADEIRGIVRGTVRSAVELTAGQVDGLKQELEKTLEKKVSLAGDVDKDLLGGVQIFIGPHIIDGSVAARIDRLHKHLLDEVTQIKLAV